MNYSTLPLNGHPPETRTSSESTPPAPRPVVGRQLATGFGLVGLAALIMGALLMATLANVAQSVRSMREGERAVRESLALAMAVREEYIHQAHTIIEGNHSHLKHYEVWLSRVHDHAQNLLVAMPVQDRESVSRVLDESRELDRVFRAELLPALDRGDQAALMTLLREGEKLSSRAVADADALAQRVEGRMNAWHAEAIRATRRGLAAGAVCMLVVVLLSVYYARHIRRSVVRPLEGLAKFAMAFGRGELSEPIAHVGEGEFQSVAWAWNRMAEELAARQEHNAHVQRMAILGQLAAGVAHEINNPIGVIRGYLRTMSPDDPPDVLREELTILDDEAGACQRIADDLLAYARAEEMVTAPVAMDELISDSVRRFAESGEGGSQSIDVDAEAATIMVDGRRLRQVTLNLLRNAAQVSPEAELVDIIGRRLPNEGYEIRVMDRGPGVAQADTQRIFEPFYSKRDGGSGLGLAVCFGIVRAHGGDLRVEPRPGGGSVFVVTLPHGPPGKDLEAS